MSITRYPLTWPIGRPRTLTKLRKSARFYSFVKGRSKVRRDVSLAESVQRVLDELSKYNSPGHTHCNSASVIISTNAETRGDGLPAGNAREPLDPGAAVYFTLDQKAYCLPCDTYERLADNLAAIAATIDAMRTTARHGVVTSHDLFAGFPALPPATEAKQSCWLVLGLSGPTKDMTRIKEHYHLRAASRHPDKPGGSKEAMQELNLAYEQTLIYANKP